MAPGNRRYTDDELRQAVATSKSIREILRELGIRAAGGNYETVRARIRDLDLDTAHLVANRTWHRSPVWGLDPAELHEVIKASRSISEVLRRFGLETTKRTQTHHRALRTRIQRDGIDTSHFLGQGWRKGDHTPPRPSRPLAQVLREGIACKSSTLRQRLIAEGLKEHVCEGCGLMEWLGRPMPLELEHVNGLKDDNRLENLQLLCPNCHALTPHYRGRNIGRYAGVRQLRIL